MQTAPRFTTSLKDQVVTWTVHLRKHRGMPPRRQGFFTATAGVVGGNAGINQATIGSWDTPDVPVPANSKPSSQLTAAHALQSISLYLVFQLDVAAATKGTAGAANQALWAEAGGSWSFNGSGSVTFLANPNRVRWNPGPSAGVTAPSGWAAVQGPRAEVITSITASDLLNQMLAFV